MKVGIMQLTDESIFMLSGRLPDDLGRRLATQWSEAKFFFQLIEEDLKRLPAGSSVLELGSGTGLLASLVAQTGVNVFAFEPKASGFSYMLELRDFLLKNVNGFGAGVSWVDDYLDPFDERIADPLSYGYAFNVIEHVPDLEGFLSSAMSVLRVGGRFRIVCPNYAIPYEPHFDMPTLWSKKLTFRVFRQRIERFPRDQSINFWHELSWPTQKSLERTLGKLCLEYNFTNRATVAYLNRPSQDQQFIQRKSSESLRILQVGAILLRKIVSFTPTQLLPIIDASLVKP